MKKFLSVLFAAVIMISCFTTAFMAFAVDHLNISGTYGQTDARSMLELINGFRTGDDAWYFDVDNTTKIEANDLAELVYDYDLERIAMQRAAELAVAFSHTRPNGESCFTLFEDNEYTAAAENIAYGYDSAEDVFVAWKEDDEDHAGQGHRRNMLSGDFVAVGIGHFTFDGEDYWVQEFRNPAVDTEEKAANDSETTVTVEVTAGGHTHRYDDGVVSKEATCVADGEKTFTCALCGETKTEVIPATGEHTWNDGKVTKAATCVSDGEKTYTCTVCGGTRIETISATGEHTWNSGKVTKAATCAKTGIIKYTCKVCKTTKTEKIAKLKTHTWDSGKVTKMPTTKATGKKLFTCKVCGKTKTVKISKVTLPAAPKSLKVTKATKQSVTLSWKKVSGATGYQIYRYKSSTGKYSKVGGVLSSNKVTIANLKTGKAYKYAVKAFKNVEGKEFYGKISKIVTAYTLTAAPKVSSIASNVSKSADLKWTKVSGAASYSIYYSTDKKTWTYAGSTTGLLGRIPGLKGGAKVYFRIYAVNKAGMMSARSKTVGVKVKK